MADFEKFWTKDLGLSVETLIGFEDHSLCNRMVLTLKDEETTERLHEILDAPGGLR